MSDSLTFMMGKHPAVLPAHLRFARNHLWCAPTAEGNRFGFTSYAVRLMQDVYFLDWQVNSGDDVALLEQIGHIETSKAVSDLFSPAKGKLLRFNEVVLADPSGINVDYHGQGWLFELVGDVGHLMNVQEYLEFLESNWEKTQRMIKGKINAGDD
ncbi:MAG: glycine cleavage system protein H [Gemmataceae bacterium]|nr:glycine cleavage system protein H [Gemmataceae bacterium]